MTTEIPVPRDRHGAPVEVGARVRLVGLSGEWLTELPPDEQTDVLSMIGQIFEIEEIDQYGHPWISKSWPNQEDGTWRAHSIAVESPEIELVHGDAP